MITLIQKLQQRYQYVRQLAPPDSELSRSCSIALKSLVLSEAVLLKQQLIASSTPLPLNVVVFGPTQAGKSTLVNCLLPEPLAGVSPLAGFTVHPQGFLSGSQSADLTWLNTFFPDYQRLDQDHLNRTDLTGFAVTDLAMPGLLANQQPTVIWDTPDFDSIDASGYLDSVLRTLALADVLILTVSKEKYADQSVWEMLELLAPLGQPLLVCINKLADGEEPTLFGSFLNRFRSQLPEAQEPELVSLPFIETGEMLNSEQILNTLNTMISQLQDHQPTDQSINFIQANWQNWLQPVKDEIKDELEWHDKLQTSIDSAMETYRDEFLDHPDYYDTFQRALAELLALLEVPVLAQSLGKARQVITWPVRKLISIGKTVIRSESNDTIARDKNYEQDLLRQLADQLITALASDSLIHEMDDESQSKLWMRDFNHLLTRSREQVCEQFQQQVSEYQSAFEHEIQDAAQQLYSRIEEQPALLNSLRAARVTTDAAAVVLALKTGGLSLNDFLLAPAMLSLSTMLAESSAGQYVNTVRARLKTRQFETVQALFTGQLQASLERLREETSMNNRFGIKDQEIREVESELSAH